MQRDKDQLLINEVKQKLDWYINDASEEEYDEQAVASLQYLLDTLEVAEGVDADVEQAWENFKEYVAEKADKEESAQSISDKEKKKAIGNRRFTLKHTGIVAAALLVVVLAVSLGSQAEAIKDEGFFHWIQRVVGGREFVTSPEEIEGLGVLQKTIVDDREDVPDNWKSWADIEAFVMKDTEFVWKRIEWWEFIGYEVARSIYEYRMDEIIVGVERYDDKLTYKKQRFDSADEWEVITIDNMSFEFCNRLDEMDGTKLKSIEFFEGNHRYYIRGSEKSVDMIKTLIVCYRQAVSGAE